MNSTTVNSIVYGEEDRKPKVAIIFGTRPEALKIIPFLKCIRLKEIWDITVISTGQHSELLDQVLSTYKLDVDYNLNIFQDNQPPEEVVINVMKELGKHVDEVGGYDMFVVQGDTSTAAGAGLLGFYRHIPVAHIEAGLRTHDTNSPFPEEVNRHILDSLATFNFPPTELEYDYLRKQQINAIVFNGMPPEKGHPNVLYFAGNTSIDATVEALNYIQENNIKHPIEVNRDYIVVTMHRRENFGKYFENFCSILEILAPELDKEGVDVLFVKHPNPYVVEMVENRISKIDNVRIIDPLPYYEFISLLKDSKVIMSDSGGIQEEVTVLKVPLVILRKNTERPLTLNYGYATWCYLDKIDDEMIEIVINLLKSKLLMEFSPYGNGTTGNFIADYFESINLLEFTKNVRELA